MRRTVGVVLAGFDSLPDVGGVREKGIDFNEGGELTMFIADTDDLPWPPFYMSGDGRRSWVRMPGDRYEVTGVDREGKRFKVSYKSWMQAKGINVYRGTRWLRRGKKRVVIERVFN